MDFSKKVFEAYQVHCSTDSVQGVLCGIYIDVKTDYFNIVSTDGRTLMKGEYPIDQWVDMDFRIYADWGHKLPDKPTSGLLSLTPKIEGLTGAKEFFDYSGDLIYPDYEKCIPTTYTRSYLTYPVFDFSVYAKMEKTFKKLKIRLSSWIPENWGQYRFSATTRVFDNYLFLAMPIRGEVNMCEKCFCQIVDGKCQCQKRGNNVHAIHNNARISGT